jgi:hypothetical protein
MWWSRGEALSVVQSWGLEVVVDVKSNVAMQDDRVEA